MLAHPVFFAVVRGVLHDPCRNRPDAIGPDAGPCSSFPSHRNGAAFALNLPFAPRPRAVPAAFTVCAFPPVTAALPRLREEI